MRQVMGLDEVVTDAAAVKKVQQTLNLTMMEFVRAGVVSGDVALGIVRSIRYFCEQRIAPIENPQIRRAMAEMLIAALEVAICGGSEVSLFDD